MPVEVTPGFRPRQWDFPTRVALPLARPARRGDRHCDHDAWRQSRATAAIRM